MTTNISKEKLQEIELVKDLKSLFLRAVRIRYYGKPGNHPVITINSIKNIIGDDRKYPSQILMDFADRFLREKPVRKRDKFILNKIRNEGVSHSVFIMDLEDALLNNDDKIVEKEAAKLFVLADSPQAILESVINLLMQDFNNFGKFSYHILRAFAFSNVQKENSWAFIQCVLKLANQFNFLGGVQKKNVEIDNFIEPVFNSNSINLISKFNAAYHIYKSDYVRTYLFKKSINTWVSEIKIDGKTMENKISAEKGLINYCEFGGKYFIEKADSILDMYSNTFLISKKLILLDSIRMLCKKISPNKLGLINLKLDLI